VGHLRTLNGHDVFEWGIDSVLVLDGEGGGAGARLFGESRLNEDSLGSVS